MSSTDRIVKLRLCCPTMSGAEIARQVSVSREYVRLVLTNHGLRNSGICYRKPKPLCEYCGKNHVKKTGSKFCSLSCWLASREKFTLVCATCGKSFTIDKSNYNCRLKDRKMTKWYCSRTCYGKVLSRLYGFGGILRIRPESKNNVERR